MQGASIFHKEQGAASTPTGCLSHGLVGYQLIGTTKGSKYPTAGNSISLEEGGSCAATYTGACMVACAIYYLLKARGIAPRVLPLKYRMLIPMP